MPRARTKDELERFGATELARLHETLSTLTTDEMTTLEVFEGRTVKDLLAHLDDWQELFLGWYREGMAGGKPAIPAPGYSFKDTPALNEELYQRSRERALADVLADLERHHAEIMRLVGGHTEEELTTKARYGWTGSTDLASYVASCTSSHYVWASGLVRKLVKRLAAELRARACP